MLTPHRQSLAPAVPGRPSLRAERCVPPCALLVCAGGEARRRGWLAALCRMCVLLDLRRSLHTYIRCRNECASVAASMIARGGLVGAGAETSPRGSVWRRDRSETVRCSPVACLACCDSARATKCAGPGRKKKGMGRHACPDPASVAATAALAVAVAVAAAAAPETGCVERVCASSADDATPVCVDSGRRDVAGPRYPRSCEARCAGERWFGSCPGEQ